MAGHSERIVFERAGGYPSVHALGLPGVPGCIHALSVPGVPGCTQVYPVYHGVPGVPGCTKVFQVYQGVPRCTRCTRLHALGLTCRLCILTTTSVQTVVRSSSKTKAFCKQIEPHILSYSVLLCVTSPLCIGQRIWVPVLITGTGDTICTGR